VSQWTQFSKNWNGRIKLLLWSAAKRQLQTASCDFINNCEIAALYFEAFFRYFILCFIMEESVHMPSEARDKVVENSVSRQAEELAAKSAEAHGAQTKSRQVRSLSEEIITPAPQTTNDAPAPAVGTARVDFVADPEPVPQSGGFLCTFTLSRLGLVGLNKLAVYLNDLQDSGSIGGWQAKGWENAATKVRTLIGFANHADAIVAIKRAP